MSLLDQELIEKRSTGRRKEDWLVRNYLQQYKALFNISLMFTSEMNMDKLFGVIIDQTNRIMNTEESIIFIYDDKENKLWSLDTNMAVSDKIRIEVDSDVAWWVFQNQSPVTINDPLKDPRFDAELNPTAGFKTRNILCIPLINGKGACIGVLQALNKISEDFTDDDVDLLTLVSYHVVIALKNSKIFEELKAVDKAKERIISHLSHELKTPLSIISRVFEILSNELPDLNISKIEKVLNRGQRNVNRLLDAQNKIKDIIHKNYDEEKVKFITFIQDTISIIEELKEEHHNKELEIMFDSISKRIESIFTVQTFIKEEVFLKAFLEDICNLATSAGRDRELKQIRYFKDDLLLIMDKNVLKKACIGLLKNAMENTLDEGRIEISLKSIDGEARISFRDYGVGITPQNQKLIFGGFFHTQDTEIYSSKIPYEFNAGGTGSDLLRIKAFSERYGFGVDFESTRCKFILEDTELCPGRISICRHITEESECLASGGSIFTLKFPPELQPKQA